MLKYIQICACYVVSEIRKEDRETGEFQNTRSSPNLGCAAVH